MKIENYGTRVNDVQQVRTYNVLIFNTIFFLYQLWSYSSRSTSMVAFKSRVLQFVGKSEQNMISEVCCIYQV